MATIGATIGEKVGGAAQGILKEVKAAAALVNNPTRAVLAGSLLVLAGCIHVDTTTQTCDANNNCTTTTETATGIVPPPEEDYVVPVPVQRYNGPGYYGPGFGVCGYGYGCQ